MTAQKSLLIVDDNEGYAALMKAHMDDLGYQADYAYDLSEAREKLKQKPNMVFLDIQLPDGNGLDFLREIKDEYPDTFFVVTTALRNPDHAVEAVSLGAVYFTKPLNRYEIEGFISVGINNMNSSLGVLMGRLANSSQKTENLDVDKIDQTMTTVNKFKLNVVTVLTIIALSVVATLYIQSLVHAIF